MSNGTAARRRQQRRRALLAVFTRSSTTAYNTDSYYDIERGTRFPRARNLMLLLRLFGVTLEQVYPDLAWGADRDIDALRHRLTR